MKRIFSDIGSSYKIFGALGKILTWVDRGLCKLEGVIYPLINVDAIVLSGSKGILAGKRSHGGAKAVPSVAAEGHLGGVLVSVNERIPNGVEVLDLALGGEVDEVTTCITLGVLIVEERDGVEWLVDVSEIVDEESESV